MNTDNKKLKIAAIALATIVVLILLGALNYYSFIGARYLQHEYLPTFIRKEIPENILLALESATSAKTRLLDPDKHQAPNAHLTLEQIGESTITDPADIKRLADFLKDGAKRARLPKLNFKPKHTIEIGEGEQSHHFLISFESNRLLIISGNEKQTSREIPFTGNFDAIADLFPSTITP